MEEIRWVSDKEKYEQNIKSRQQRIIKDRKIRPPRELTEREIMRLMVYNKTL